MGGNIVFVDSPLTDKDLARRIAPSGFELQVVGGGSPEYEAALPAADRRGLHVSARAAST